MPTHDPEPSYIPSSRSASSELASSAGVERVLDRMLQGSLPDQRAEQVKRGAAELFHQVVDVEVGRQRGAVDGLCQLLVVIRG